MDVLIPVLLVIVAAGLGIAGGLVLSRRGIAGGASLSQAQLQAEQVLADAETKRKEALLEAKEEAIRLKTAAEAEVRAQAAEVKVEQQRLRGKEEQLDRKLEGLEARERRQQAREQEVESRAKEVDELRAGELKELERIGRLSPDEAREQLLARVEGEIKEEASRRARLIINNARLSADEEARRLITLAVQRLAGDHIGETTVASVPIPSEDMKGRIIGREGRNIRALEAATGVDLIIDETPDAVMISGFDPVRREIARIALTKLVADGRIHPQRIEEVVAKATQEVEEGIVKAGEEAALEAGVHGLHPEILKVFGRM
jgi:ribonuclease Y